MSKFEIKRGIDSILNSNGKALLDIEFLGIGGAFDIEEGDSSMLLKTVGGKYFLIDCGYTSYSKIKKKGIINLIDKVFITHSHEDHLNRLSTLIYDRFYIHNIITNIECTEEVGKRVKTYLDVCGQPEEQYSINIKNIFIEDEGISITKINTTSYHWPVKGFPNSGLLFHFSVGDDYFIVIYSGDINIPITNIMNMDDYLFVYDKPENVFIFHDMTSIMHEKNAHTNFKLLIPLKKKFKNLFTYHHGESDVEIINKENPEIALTSLIVQGNSFVIEKKRGL